jgi:cytochrome c oxidase subunit 1
MRAPGMSLSRIPLFVWSELVVAFMVIFAMPAVALVSSGMLLLDRLVGTQFFNPAEGGDALLYQHVFWFFGHPEVYIIFLPGAGIVSTIIAAFSGRKILGYVAAVLSLVATGFIGFSVWVHHMFVTGLPDLSMSFFSAATLAVVLPTAVQFFLWIGTLALGRVRMELPLLWIMGFFFVFLIGGLSGVMQALIPIDTQVHDTYFVVAHFHYVLIGGAVFPMFAGLYYWWPKITGRLLNTRAGQWHFWLFFIGFHFTFFPMHFSGLRGMPRRVYTYLPEMHLETLNLVSTLGAALLFVAVVIFLGNMLWTRRHGLPAGNNPWGAGTLEWATTSPPPIYNFLRLPTVNGREALWEADPDQPYVAGLHDDAREVLLTKAIDGDPDYRTDMPSPTIWPFLASVAVTILFIGSIFSQWAVVWGSIPVAITMIGWFWPDKQSAERRRSREIWDRR